MVPPIRFVVRMDQNCGNVAVPEIEGLFTRIFVHISHVSPSLVTLPFIVALSDALEQGLWVPYESTM
jgi:hypothetical protein